MIDRSKLTGLAWLLMLGAIALPHDTARAQSARFRSCAVSDARCMDELVGASCLQALPGERAPCVGILAELERRLPSVESAVLAAAAFAHAMLAQYPTSAADGAAHRADAERLYLEVIAIEPNHADAYLGLSSLAQSTEQQIRWLRRAVAASDSSSLMSGFLARALDLEGTYASRLEAAEVMRSAYAAYESGQHKWFLAENVLSRYRNLGLQAEALEFIERVESDFEPGSRLEQLWNAASEPDAAIASLGSLCSQEIFRLLGGAGCRAGAERLFAVATRTDDQALALSLARGLLREVMELPLTAEAASWAPDMVPWLERLLEAGVASWEIYSALGRCRLELDQSVAALDAFERARALASAGTATLREREFLDQRIRQTRGGALPDPYRESCPTRVIVVN